MDFTGDNGPTVELNRFHFNAHDVCNSTCSLVIGRHNIRTVKLLINRYSKLPNIYPLVFGNTELDDLRFPFIPKKCIYDQYYEEVLKDLLANQIRYVRNNGRHSRHMLLIFHDSLTSDIIDFSNTFKELMRNTCGYNVKIIIYTMYPFNIGPRYRVNLDLVFLEDIYDEHAMTRIYRDYFGIYNTKEEFTKVCKNIIGLQKNIPDKSAKEARYILKKIVGKDVLELIMEYVDAEYCGIMINNCIPDREPQNIMRWYKKTKITPKRVGPVALWEHNQGEGEGTDNE